MMWKIKIILKCPQPISIKHYEILIIDTQIVSIKDDVKIFNTTFDSPN